MIMKYRWIFIDILCIFIGFGTDSKTLSYNCNDYTVDKCVLEEDAILETLKGSSASVCQFYCKDIYPEICKFFILDQKQNMCMLMQEPLDHYTASCRKMSGPDTPSIHDCEMMDDKCKVGNKIFFGEITYLALRVKGNIGQMTI